MIVLDGSSISCRYGKVAAVKQVSLTLSERETIGLVGESGCGKTTLARTLVGLRKPEEGRVLFHGKPLDSSQFCGKLQMVFQDPAASLNPRRSVWQNVAVPLKTADEQRIATALRRVELPEETWHRLPATLSGGQQQRAAIARAFIGRPDCIICDEPVSFLDMSARAGIINLLKKLGREDGVSMLVISHDLRMVFTLCEKIAVMDGGEIVEFQETRALFSNPQHEKTKALLAAIPPVPGR